MSDNEDGSEESDDLVNNDSASDGDSPPPLENADGSLTTGHQHMRTGTTVLHNDDAGDDEEDDDEDPDGPQSRFNRANTVVVRQDTDIDADPDASKNNLDPMSSITEDLSLVSPRSQESDGADADDNLEVPKSTLSAASTETGSREEKPIAKRSQTTSPKKKKKGHHKKRSTFSGKKKPPPGTPAFWIWLEEEKQMRPNFANPKKVLKWTAYEVAYWMKQNKYEKYAVNFLQEKVTGEMMIRDLDTEILKQELGVKLLHCGNILRRVKKLKEVRLSVDSCVCSSV